MKDRKPCTTARLKSQARYSEGARAVAFRLRDAVKAEADYYAEAKKEAEAKGVTIGAIIRRDAIAGRKALDAGS